MTRAYAPYSGYPVGAAGLVEANRYVELGIFSEYRARKPV